MSVLLDQQIATDYGQFDVLSDAEIEWSLDDFFTGQSNGWVGAAMPGSLHVGLADRTGSRVRIELHDQVPDLGSWEDVVEVSVVFQPGSVVRWESWAGESGGPLALPPATYRVRVSANGRDEAREGCREPPLDFYLIEFWPAALTENDIIVRTTSEDAAYWNGALGGRRES